MNPLFIKSKENWELSEHCFNNDIWLASGASRAYYSILQRSIALLRQHGKETEEIDEYGNKKSEGSHNFVKQQIILLLLEKNLISAKDKGGIIKNISNMKKLRVKADYSFEKIEKPELQNSLNYGRMILRVMEKL